MNESKKINITFAPGAFDSFDGTQEELDQMISEIQKMFEDETFLENSQPIDIDELLNSDNPDDQMLAMKLLESLKENPVDRNLQ